MTEPSLTTRLQQRANQQPGGTAHTFIDYDVDPAGVAQSVPATVGGLLQERQAAFDARRR